MSPGQTLYLVLISCITSNVTSVSLISTCWLLLKHCLSVTSRVATPFGGFSKAPRPAPIKPLQLEPVPDYPELQGDTAINRPSFNRSATGWVSVGGPVPLHTVSLEPVLIPESEDLWTHEVTQRCCLLRCCTMVSRARESVLLGFDGSTYAACTVFLVLSWFSRDVSYCTAWIHHPVQ